MTTDERQRLWFAVYAFHAMTEAGRTVRFLLEKCSDNLSPLFLPLAIATHAQYCRPFNRMDGINPQHRFSAGDVPPEFRGQHEFMVAFRNQVFVHTDTDTGGMGDQLHNVFVHLQSDGPHFEWFGPSTRREHYEAVSPLIDAMALTAAERLRLAGESVRAHIKSPGLFRLVLKGSAAFESVTT